MTVQPTLDNTVGAVFLGMAGSAFIVGLTSLQVYLYYHRYQDDSILHKYSVGILWFLDTFHLILVVHAVYYYAVTNFGNAQNLDFIVWSVKAQMPVNVIIVIMVQSLYAYRVWKLSGFHHGPVARYSAATAVLFGCTIGIVFTYNLVQAVTYTEIHSFGWMLDVTLAATTVIDLLIAASMVYYLRKSKGPNLHFNSRLSRMMQYTLGSGALTSACSLSCMFTWLLLPNTLNFQAIGFFLTKLYVGSFLAMLNSRERKPAGDSRFRVEVTTSTTNHIELTSPKSSTKSPMTASESHSKQPMPEPW